jgi:V8-like Glu-specific endopeptidase
MLISSSDQMAACLIILKENSVRFQRVFTTALAMVCTALPSAAIAQTTDPLLSETMPFAVDSGVVQNLGAELAPVWATEVLVPQAPWLRLWFEEVTLAGTVGTDGSFLKIISTHDGHWQRLDAEHVENWSLSSAYFNGESVIVELWAYPNTGANRLIMNEVMVGQDPVDAKTICFTTDDRVLSHDTRVGRLSTGCTGWLINHNGSANRYLTAGHCITNGSVGNVMFFNVPLSTATGAFVAPPPEYQYPVQASSIQSNGGVGVGNDMATFQTFANSNTGLTPFAAQGGAFQLAAAAPAAANQTLRISGFGLRDANFPQIPLTWSRTQKTHTGPFVSRTATEIRYQPDTTGGNSGSPVVLESNGLAIGIHTHGGCNTGGGSNAGTTIEHPTLQGYLNNAQGTSLPQAPLSCLQTVFNSDNGGSPGGAVYFDAIVGNTSLDVRALELNIGSALSTEFGVRVYITPNTANGKITSPGQWTLVGQGWGLATGNDNATRVVLNDSFVLERNESFGVAIVLDGASHRYTNGTGSNEIYSDSSLRLASGWATNVPFSGGINSPRVFNGRLCYEAENDWVIGNLFGNDATQSFNLKDGRIKAMGFRMPAAQDYILDSAVLRLEFEAFPSIPLVRIFSNVGNAPGSLIATLTNPGILFSGTRNYQFTPSSPIALEGGSSYWLVAYSSGTGTMNWMASDAAQTPTGVAIHNGSLFSASSGPTPPSSVNTSTTLNTYAIYGMPGVFCTGDIADDFGTLGSDGQVSFGDFLALLGLIGPCPGGNPGCVGDIADDFGTVGGDGQVSFGDFLALLGLIGPC